MCTVFTIDQQCADWLILRNIRITGPIAERITLSDEDVFSAVVVAETESPKIQIVGNV